MQEIQNAGARPISSPLILPTPTTCASLPPKRAPLDILINNAGVYNFGATADTDDAFFDEHVNLNLRAPYILVQQLVPGMAARGNGASSTSARWLPQYPAKTGGIYGATKAGVELLTRVWADEFGRSGVRVNAVQPGPPKPPAPTRRQALLMLSPPTPRWGGSPRPTRSPTPSHFWHLRRRAT